MVWRRAGVPGDTSESGDLRQSEGFRDKMKEKAETQPRNEMGQFVGGSQASSAGSSGAPEARGSSSIGASGSSASREREDEGISRRSGAEHERERDRSGSDRDANLQSGVGRDDMGRFTSK
jgi:hypothetical protein